jgi:hypothetical protein
LFSIRISGSYGITIELGFVSGITRTLGSIFNPDFKQLKKVKFYRKGRYKSEETNETYLFLTAEERNSKKVYLVCFNEKNEFATAMKLVEKTN